MPYLDDIIAYKREHRSSPPADLEQRVATAPPVRPFRELLGTYRTGVIAECKKASPSQGLLVEEYDPVRLACRYQDGGASAISVLTDETFFRGSMADLEAVRGVVELPVLRKDFMLEEQDVLEARAAGADIVLLIARVLEPAALDRLIELASELGMDALVEVHDEADVDVALNAACRLMGINNRDLTSFDTDLAVTERLMKIIPSQIAVVSESGISSGIDVAALRVMGVRTVLVGEALLRAKDPAALLGEMVEAGCPDCWLQRQLESQAAP